jgi:anti-sigma factor RsiW
MQCRDARELLDSFIGEELLVETNHELLRHLATCPDCSTELEGRRRIRSGVKQAFVRSADLQVRPEFAEQLKTRLRASAQPTSRRAWQGRWLAIAASLLVVVVGAGTYLLRARVSEVTRLAAGDHQNCAVRFALQEKPISLKEAAERYDAAYAQLETTPPDTFRTAAGTLHIADRHSCVFGGRRFGHVVLRLDDHLVSVLMTRDETTAGSSKTGARQLSWLPRMNGYGMASFRTAGHVVYIVSDLQDADFRKVAEALADPVSRLTALVMCTPLTALD